MKIQKQLWIQILAGLAALAPVSSPVQAHAIEDDGARQTASQRSKAANGGFSSETVMPVTTAVGPTTQAEAELARATVTDTVLLAIVLAGTVLIIAYTSVATRRRRELRPVLNGRIRGISYRPPAGVASR